MFEMVSESVKELGQFLRVKSLCLEALGRGVGRRGGGRDGPENSPRAVARTGPCPGGYVCLLPRGLFWEA